MGDIDYEALNDSYKGLSVIFIISICVINGLLIFKTARNGGFLYNPKSLTLISLAIGDIFLALFSLVVFARGVFEPRIFNPSCSTLTAYYVYMNFFIHFVYGVGLIVLAGELLYRYRSKPANGRSNIDIIRAFIFSAVPWLLALVIVLPVTMGGTLREGCLSAGASRTKAMFTVCVLLPACLAVVVSIVTLCIRLESVQYTSQVVSYQGSTPGMVIATHNTTNGLQQYQVNGVAGTQQMSTVPPATHYNAGDNQNEKRGDQLPQYHTQPNLPPQYPTQQHFSPQYPTPANLAPQYPPQYYLPPQYPTQFPVQQQSAQSNVIIATPVYSPQSQILTTPPLQDPGREKNVLLTVSIIFLVCVVPFAAYIINLVNQSLSGGMYIYDAEFETVIRAVLMWLSVFRSVITPVIWMACSKN